MVAGFPGIEREKISQKHYSLGSVCFSAPVDSVSDRNLGIAPDRSQWVDLIGRGIPTKSYDFGGLSGAPALALVKSDGGIVSWRLAGIVYEALGGEIVMVHHGDLIEADGTVCEFA